LARVGEKTTVYCLSVEKNLEGKQQLQKLRTDGHIVLKLILKRRNGRVWLVTEKICVFLYTC